MIVRFERWGAWVKLESTAALVAVDRVGMRALGLDGGDAWTSAETLPSAPLEVHLAVTSRCGAGCKGCYLDATPDGHEPSRQTLESRLDAMRDAGVFTVAFGGGEPTTRDDLADLAMAARARGITPVATTSGLGLSDARVERLRAFAQVNVSYDGASEAYESVRGFDGASVAERAIGKLAKAGVRVGVNVVLTRGTFPSLTETLMRAKALGASEGQLLRYKPAGRGASLDYFAQRMTVEQVRSFPQVVRALSCALSADRAFAVRIDCALVPFLSTDNSLAGDPALLARLGIFGCEAGDALAAVTVSGWVAPCSFAPATTLPSTHLATDHARDEDLARWRRWPTSAPEPCASCPIRTVCKGGCKVVASFVDGEHGPDPECPRVLAWRSSHAR